MKKIIKAAAALIAVLLLAAGAYIAYLFIDYERLPDNLELPCVLNSDVVLPAGEELSAVSWNIGFGAYNDDFSFFMDGGSESRAYSEEICEENIRRAISALKQLDADLMLLQEVDVKGTRSHGVNQREMIEGAFAGSHSSVYAQNYDSGYLFYPFHSPIGANRSGLLTLCDARIESALRRSLPIESGLRRFFDLDRCYSVSSIPVSGGKYLMLFNLHLSAYTADGTIAVEQIRLMLAQMRDEYEKGNYVIAGGDFNMDLWGDSSAYTGVSGEAYSWAQPFPADLPGEGFALCDSLRAEKPVLSCRNADMPYVRGQTFEVTLDGFIVSENVQPVSCEIIDEGFLVSDHNPVMLRFVLEP